MVFPGLRVAKRGRYNLYFPPKADVVEIVRVPHEARDLTALFDR